MTNEQVSRNVVRSTLSGYLRLAVRMGLGLVTFRLLYQSLSPEEFGFWSLLWTLFGYGVLLDFGFGFAAQKRVAELTVRGDWTELSRILSTILIAYLVSAAVLSVLGILCSGALVDLFRVSAANRERFRVVLGIFLAGIGLAFPLGLFPEILLGQQRLTTANNVSILSLLANCAAVVLTTTRHLGFTTLVVLTLLCVLIPYCLAAWLALRHMPHVRLRPSLFSRTVLAETSRFSLYAYLNTLGTTLRNRSDQPVISALLGVAAVTPYQSGSKVGEMFGLLTRQIADVLAPTAAHLHARGDSEALRRMLIAGLRSSVLAATPLYLVSAAYMDGLIRFLTGLAQPTPEMYWTGQLLLFWYYSLTITHWVFKRMYLMAGQERRLMWQGVAEAATNLALSIVLTLILRNVLGVALGSLIPTLAFGWGILWGWAAREARMTRCGLLAKVVLPAWKGCLPMIAATLAIRCQPWWSSGTSTPRVLAEGALVTAIGLAGTWFLGLDPAERARFRHRLEGGIRASS